jgi:hypothetical protein
VRKALTWLALAIAAMWVIHNPTAAAADLRQVMHALSTLVSAL